MAGRNISRMVFKSLPILMLCVGASLLIGASAPTQVDCAFTNTLDQAIVLELDGVQVDLAAGAQLKEVLPEGATLGVGLDKDSVQIFGVIGEQGESSRTVEFSKDGAHIKISEQIGIAG